MSPHTHVLTVGVNIGPMLLWIALLAAIPIVTGFALLRGFVGQPGRRTELAVVGVAAAAVLLELILAGGLDLPEQAIPLIVAALAGPVYVIQTRNTKRATVISRMAPLVLGLAGILAIAELIRGWTSARPAVFLHTGLVLALTGLAWFVVCRPRARISTSVVRGTAIIVAIAAVGAMAQAAALRTPAPEPGVATVHQAIAGSTTLDLLVVPNRPGWNLVHLPTGEAEVGTHPDSLVRAQARPGTTGAWAEVYLRPGRSALWVRHRNGVGIVDTDTGTGAPAPTGITGPDGPECASAALGAMLAAPDPATTVVRRCPADVLEPADAAALRGTIDFLTVLGVRTIALVTDNSSRSAAAERTVRAAARAANIGIATGNPPATPMVVVAGWSAAVEALRQATDEGRMPRGGAYLAPWLVAPRLLDQPAGSRVPLRRAPAGDLPNRYLEALRAAYPEQPPTAAGYQAWLAEQRIPVTDPVQLYQVAPTTGRAGPNDPWLTGATVTAMSGPLAE